MCVIIITYRQFYIIKFDKYKFNIKKWKFKMRNSIANIFLQISLEKNKII